MKSFSFLCCFFALVVGTAAEPQDDQHRNKNSTQAPARLQQPIKAKPRIRYNPARFPGEQNAPRIGSSKWAAAQQGGIHRKSLGFANRPNPNIPNARFSAGARISGSENWKGQKYEAFRTYRSEWHDRDWWRSHHSRIIFVFGGWYFWNAGYWCPAWGYDPYAYYAYDGPIYAGSPAVDPAEVVANVQTELQAEGYYDGDIDGILGPLTRAAIASYQQDHGLYITSAIDEPTLESLGLA
jgi:hypothetical protein